MPEGYTHVRTARLAAAAIRYKIWYPAAFAAGANGPDSFFCFEVWKKRAKRRYDLIGLGNRMHEEKTGDFLFSLCRHVRTRPQMEYVLGFLCHYAADTVMHPFVFAMCEEGKPYAQPGGHGFLEIGLDSTLYRQDTGSGAVNVEDVSPLPVGEELSDIITLLRDSLREVYGEAISPEYIADAFYHIYKLRGLFATESPVVRGFFKAVEPLFGKKGMIMGHVTPCELSEDLPDRWKDPFTGAVYDGGVRGLLPRAQQRCEQYMSAALLFWGDRLSADELRQHIGSMSYTAGIATPASDPENTTQKENEV